MSSKRALITGITGQDGSYLSEWLLSEGYEVHGIVRRVALEDPDHRLSRLKDIRGRLKLHAASLESYASIHRVIHEVQPDECYHLAAQSFVSYSFDDEFSTLNTNINGTHFLLAAVKTLTPHCRFYFAGSSEMFGLAETVPQNENTRFHPRSSYGISKVAGFDLTRNYRELMDVRRQRDPFQRIAAPGFRVRDTQDRRVAPFWREKARSSGWGTWRHTDKHAREYVEAMWRMLQQPEADD
jgi:GDPmannose 4,6-dehydratase